MDAALKHFGPEIWIADGPVVTAAAGFHYPTRMAVIRLADGGLFVWSPVALSDKLRTEVEALGPVRRLVAPNSLHHSFLGEWRRAFPEAKLFGAPGVRQACRDLDVDGDLEDAAPEAWANEIDQVLMRGNLITTEVVFFHRRSGTALFTDLIQHFSPSWFTGWRAMIAKWDLMAAPNPEVPRKYRNAFIDRRAARAAIQLILAWPAERVLMAHAPPIESDGAAFIARAFRWLLAGS